MQASTLFLLMLAPTLGGGTQPMGLGASGIAPPSRCAQCHSDGSGGQLPNDMYRGTAMHLASVDPFYIAALEVAFADVGEGAEMCVRCHVPTGWLAGRGTPANGTRVSSGDKHGISCDLCHRAVLPDLPPATQAEGDADGGPLADGDAPEDPLAARFDGLLLENAQLFIQEGNDIKHGPHGSVPSQGHDAELSSLISDSRHCAHCHEVSIPETTRKNLDGTDTGRPMPIERTYTEWKNSKFSDPVSGQTCQDCHMPSFTGVAANNSGVPTRELGSHTIVGGNTLVSRMVAHLYATRDIDELRNLSEDAERVTAAARQLLQEESAVLEARDVGPDGRLKVRITNLTGHKLPTGYAEGRRMWLGHEVTYLDGSPALRTGTPDSQTFDFVMGEEPERVWEIKLGSAADNAPSFHFALVDAVYKDNRIPPEGFIPNEDTAHVGYTYPANADGTLPNWDEVELALGEPECWPVVVNVKLYYQMASGEYYRFLRDNAPNARADLESAWIAVGGSVPEVMQHIQVAVFENGEVQTVIDASALRCDVLPQPDAGVTTDGAEPEAEDGGTSENPDDGGSGGSPEPGEPSQQCTCIQSADAPLSHVAWLALLLLPLCRSRRRS